MRLVRHPSTKEEIILFDSLEEMIAHAAEGLRPQERITVSQAAERYHIVKRAPMHDGPFSLTRAPYLVEPMDVLTSLDHTGMVFIGPARTGKSAMFLNWMAHTAIHDPTDMMLVHMATHTAREWSQTDLEKMLRDSPEVKKRLVPGRQNDNVFDKRFMSGMRLGITWPTITNLSGKTLRYAWIMDYDREPLEIDKEGDKWTLTKKRTQTYKRFGMTVAETSPGHPVEDPKWMPATPHEPPPAKGLLSIYAESDRRRWYWRCPSCHSAFEPHRKLLVYPNCIDPMEAAEQVEMACPHCGSLMKPGDQRELNLGGRWLKEGQTWLPNGEIVGVGKRSPIAGFWMFGPAAAFTDWTELVYKYLIAEKKFDDTGDEGPVQTVITTDFGEPYTPKALEAGRLPEELKSRAKAYAKKGEVPPGVAFLITTIDVQAGGRPSFVCHTYGLAPVQVGERWALDVYHVDMWKIRKSPMRTDEDDQPALIDPAAYPEDWHTLLSEVIERTYPLADESGRRMAVKLIACDSGGAASAASVRANKNIQQEGRTVSVTANAYEFWRWLKQHPEGRNHHLRFHLLKGQGSPHAPEIHKTLPDSQQKDKFSIARGDVPVWLLNSDKGKDQVFNMLGRTEPGGQIHFPVWFDDDGGLIEIDWLYSQLTTEIRTTKGWSNPSRRRNESFDLLYYLWLFLKHPDIRAEHINWEAPPGWANPDWDHNDLVVLADQRPFEPPSAPSTSLSDLGGVLG